MKYSLFPIFESPVLTPAAIKYLQGINGMELVDDAKLKDHARALLQNAVNMLKDDLLSHNVCIVHLFRNTTPESITDTSVLKKNTLPSDCTGLMAQKANDQMELVLRTISISVAALEFSDDEAIRTFLHEATHVFQQQFYHYDPDKFILPHDGEFENYNTYLTLEYNKRYGTNLTPLLN